MKLKILFLFICLCISLSSCYFGRFVVWNYADINDYKKFPSAAINNSGQPFSFFYNSKKNIPDSISWEGQKYKLEAFLFQKKSVAFLIIRNDTILYENYFDGYDASGIVPSFSVSKSIVSGLVGIALGEGAIKSVQQPITDYLPELKGDAFKKITIEHLLNMRSGINCPESQYNPFGSIVKSYYGRNLMKQLEKLTVKDEPDQKFDYNNYNTQLLGFIVERATGKLLADYLQEKLWKPMGMEYDATWSIDSKKHKEAKAFCCLNARARDYAKLGRLYLNKGNWNGNQLIPEDWVKKSTTITKDSKDNFYSYQWWHNVSYSKISDSITEANDSLNKIVEVTSKTGEKIRYMTTPQNDFLANGLLGQFIYVYPEKNIIIVRLGDKSDVYWPNLLLQVAKSL